MAVDGGRTGQRLRHRRGGGVQALHHQAQRIAGLLQRVGQTVGRVQQAAGCIETAAAGVEAQEFEAVPDLWHEAAEQLDLELAAEHRGAGDRQQIVARPGRGTPQLDLRDRAGAQGQAIVELQPARGITGRQAAVGPHRPGQGAAAGQRGAGVDPERAGSSAPGDQGRGVVAAGVQVPG